MDVALCNDLLKKEKHKCHPNAAQSFYSVTCVCRPEIHTSADISSTSMNSTSGLKQAKVEEKAKKHNGKI